MFSTTNISTAYSQIAMGNDLAPKNVQALHRIMCFLGMTSPYLKPKKKENETEKKAASRRLCTPGLHSWQGHVQAYPKYLAAMYSINATGSMSSSFKFADCASIEGKELR